MLRVIRSLLYYAMFPIFVVGAACFYVALRVRLMWAPRAESHLHARAFIHHGARLLFFILRHFSLVRVSVEGLGGVATQGKASVIAANHPSMLDAMLLLSIVPNAVCIMKRSLMRVPVVSGFARLAGYVPYGDAPEMFGAAADALASGAALIIFPEGTRSPEGAVGEFRRGAARIAVQAGVPIELFLIEMSPVVLGPGRSWLSPPTDTVRYQAVRMDMGEGEIKGERAQNPEQAREESIRLTKYLEDRVRSSLFSAAKAHIPGAV